MQQKTPKNSNLETRELMEEIFPLTDQVNLLSEGSRYAYDSLLTSQFLNYGTKTNANTKSNSNTNINNTTCNNNNTCSPLPSKRHRESLRRQSARGMSRSGTLKSFQILFSIPFTTTITNTNTRVLTRKFVFFFLEDTKLCNKNT